MLRGRYREEWEEGREGEDAEAPPQKRWHVSERGEKVDMKRGVGWILLVGSRWHGDIVRGLVVYEFEIACLPGRWIKRSWCL